MNELDIKAAANPEDSQINLVHDTTQEKLGTVIEEESVVSEEITQSQESVTLKEKSISKESIKSEKTVILKENVRAEESTVPKTTVVAEEIKPAENKTNIKEVIFLSEIEKDNREEDRKEDRQQEEPKEKEDKTQEEPEQNKEKKQEEPKQSTTEEKTLLAPTSDYKNGISVFCFSQQGESHIKKGIPCQDCSAFRFLDNGILIAAIADGVGSCVLSEYGADVAVHASLDYLENMLAPFCQQEAVWQETIQHGIVQQETVALESSVMGKLLRETMQYAFEAVEKKAEEMEQLSYSFQSTLTVAVYDSTTLFFGHAGDDGIVALNEEGRYAMVTSRHKGDEASSVYPLQSRSTWQFGKVDHTVAFVMATDGVMDAFVRSEAEENRVYYPFVEPVFYTAQKNVREAAAVCKDWYEYMSEKSYRKVVSDDITFVGVVNQYKIRSSAEPVFDLAEWKRKSKEYEARRMALLYPSEPKEKKTKFDKQAKLDGQTKFDRQMQFDKQAKRNSGIYKDNSERMGSSFRNFGSGTVAFLANMAADTLSIMGEGLNQMADEIIRRNEKHHMRHSAKPKVHDEKRYNKDTENS